MYDITSASLHSALRGLSARRDAIAGNIANVETGGYLAQRVEFEDAIAAALDAVERRGAVGATGRMAAVAPTASTSTDATRLNGNNVNLDDEVLAQTETELAYSTVLEAMNSKFRLLRTSINGQ